MKIDFKFHCFENVKICSNIFESNDNTIPQIMSMKQDNQALAMSIALKSQTAEGSKKKPFYKALFKSKKKVSF